MIKQIENKLSSREVYQMMDLKQHSDLLRKIDSINEDFRESKIAFSKYWIESTYKVEGQTREYREFQITKRGCEFLAHKTTGTKGNLFTDRYMDKFEAMENVINNNTSMDLGLANQMLNLAQGTQVIGQVVQGMMQTVSGIKEYVQDSIKAKDHQIDQAMDLIGIRSKNMHRLTGKLKEVLFCKYGRYINASNIEYQNAKNKVFKEFKVYKWEEISVTKYNAVEAFIEEMFY